MKACFELNDDGFEKSSEEIGSHDGDTQLAALILAAQDEECARIARDLHDDICQQISVIAWDLRTLAGRLEPAGRKSIDSVLGKLDHMGVGLRAISHRLHPSIVSDLGLLAAVEYECAKFSEMTAVAVDLRTEGSLDVSGHRALALFRVLQESLNNIRKHAQASKVKVALKRTSSQLSLRVQDFGVGFDTARARGLGLTSMRERMALERGKLTIRSSPGEGTVVEARLETGQEERASKPPKRFVPCSASRKAPLIGNGSAEPDSRRKLPGPASLLRRNSPRPVPGGGQP